MAWIVGLPLPLADSMRWLENSAACCPLYLNTSINIVMERNASAVPRERQQVRPLLRSCRSDMRRAGTHPEGACHTPSNLRPWQTHESHRWLAACGPGTVQPAFRDADWRSCSPQYTPQAFPIDHLPECQFQILGGLDRISY